ncbi:MAG: L-aspartate oxidase [Campylobacterota bacterium]|nr:L-aspartate oxidase [Campylobacterota bacterium]
MKKSLHVDVIVVGAGIAGLYAALQIPKDKKVLIINKTNPWECNTYYAQGGVAKAYDENDIESHINDTIVAGAHLCNEEAVRILSEHSIEVIDDLIEQGFEFDKNEDGTLQYTKEAAHARSRILHAGGDVTGRHLHRFLFDINPHMLLSNAMVIDLMIEDAKCYGVVVESDGEFQQIYAQQTVIASGGVGGIYDYHTNAYSISGDLQGICVEKGVELENMEMMQFHPTVYIDDHSAQKYLLTEALRGEGAKVEDEDGYRFLKDYHEDEELAPRDIVSRAIYDYALKTSSQVYLSFRDFDVDYFKTRFPNICLNLRDLGFDVPKKRVPISPAFHYAIGGIKVNTYGEVPNVAGLFAVGEVASTGVHGANRLASNSLLEGLVFASRVSKKIDLDTQKSIKKFQLNNYVLKKDDDKAKKDELRRIMWKNVSIIKTLSGLMEAKSKIEEMLKSDIGRLLQLRLLTSLNVIESALGRKESVGVHFIKEEND